MSLEEFWLQTERPLLEFSFLFKVMKVTLLFNEKGAFIFSLNLPSLFPSCWGYELQNIPFPSWVQAIQLNLTLSSTSGSSLAPSTFMNLIVTQSEPLALRPQAKYSPSSLNAQPMEHRRIHQTENMEIQLLTLSTAFWAV